MGGWSSMKVYLEFCCRDCGGLTECLEGSARHVSDLCADCFEKEPVKPAAKSVRAPAALIPWKIVSKEGKNRVKWFIRYSDPVRRAVILARCRRKYVYDSAAARRYYLANRAAKIQYGKDRKALRVLLGL
jgi:hypothetical protein